MVPEDGEFVEQGKTKVWRCRHGTLRYRRKGRLPKVELRHIPESTPRRSDRSACPSIYVSAGGGPTEGAALLAWARSGSLKRREPPRRMPLWPRRTTRSETSFLPCNVPANCWSNPPSAMDELPHPGGQMTATNAFVSYSHSNAEHEDWVLRLATELRASGVDAILDKWDLREGHEADAFMEKMVTDKTIKKVIIVSDRVYTEKSDSREGGAGTEAQIISKELYQKEDQDKFVAVVTERNERGEPYLPAYYTSRIFIDFSDDGLFSGSFEQLMRWIEDKPLHERPPLGELPSYVREGERTVTISTGPSRRRAYEAISGSKGHAYSATNDYFDFFVRELEKFRLDPEVNPLAEDFLENFRAFLPYRDECLDVMRAISRPPQWKFPQVRLFPLASLPHDTSC